MTNCTRHVQHFKLLLTSGISHWRLVFVNVPLLHRVLCTVSSDVCHKHPTDTRSLGFGASGTRRARTVHHFCLDNLLDAIVLLCCCPVRCRVVELVPHFTLHALRTALYMLSLGQ